MHRRPKTETQKLTWNNGNVEAPLINKTWYTQVSSLRAAGKQYRIRGWIVVYNVVDDEMKAGNRQKMWIRLWKPLVVLLMIIKMNKYDEVYNAINIATNVQLNVHRALVEIHNFTLLIKNGWTRIMQRRPSSVDLCFKDWLLINSRPSLSQTVP